MAKEKTKEKEEKVLSKQLTVIDNIVKNLQKDFGKESVTYLGNKEIVDIPRFTTGCSGLDFAIGGGYPQGKIIEIYGEESSGKSTLCYHAIASAQKNLDVPVALIDIEYAFDPYYAKALGVDVEKLIVSQPDDGTEALNILLKMIDLGVKCIVVDSVAALMPKEEADAGLEQNQMGVHARLMSRGLKKVTQACGSKCATVLFTNQIRDKIGIMYGCFQYNTRVMLADGTSEKIGKIVNNKISTEVLSYDEKTNKIVPRKIVNWFDNGNADKFLQFVVEKNYDNGLSQFAVTENHLILVPDGCDKNGIMKTKYVTAGELSIGDFVVGKTKKMLKEEHYPFILGNYLGDGCFRFDDNKKASMRVLHEHKQVDYCLWKMEKLGELIRNNCVHKSSNGYCFETMRLSELWEYKDYYEENDKCKIDDRLLKYLSPLSVAIWYMDNGTFSGSYKKWGWGKCSIACSSFEESIDILKKRLIEIGFPEPIYYKSCGTLNWIGEDSKIFQEMICKYIHPNMQYKLKPCFRNKFEDFDLPEFLNEEIAIPVKILDIYEKPKTKSMRKFDIEVEGNHSYLVDGVVVHNSPETTPGGKALRFYASIRIKLKKLGLNSEGTDKVSAKIKAQIVKNKTAIPFKETEFTIRFGKGIDELDALITMAIETGIIDKKGSWFSYEGKNIAQGNAELRSVIETDSSLLERIKSLLKEKSVSEIKLTSEEKKKYEEENEKELDTEKELVNEEAVSVETI